jgi:ABC-type cobalamin/Fe3+-siderophores transport system ATPase subunit
MEDIMDFEVINSSFKYKKSRPLLNNINFSIGKSEILSILGANGVGKTTLLRCMLGMLPWTMGGSFLDGINPAVKVLEAAGKDSDMSKLLIDAANAAADGANNTTTMIAVHGRAAIRGEQSRSLLDPGAVVAKILIETASKYLTSII